MQAALRSYVTSGIAIVGVSVIAVAPIAATPRDIKIASPAVELTASPFDAYETLFNNSLSNIQGLIAQAIAPPPPPSMLPFTLDSLISGLFDVSNNIANFQKQLSGLSQQLSSLQQLTQLLLQAAQGKLQAGDYAGALDIVLYTGLFVAGGVAGFAVYPLTLLGPDVQEVAPSFAEAILNAAVAPALSGVATSGEVAQDVLDALKAGNPQDVLGDLIEAPAVIANGVLNGTKLQTSIFGTVEIPGILTDATLLSAEGPGPIALAIQLGQFTRALLTPPAAAALSPTTTQGTSATVNLDVNPDIEHADPQDIEESTPTADPKTQSKGNTLGADEVTNSSSDLSKVNTNRPRLFGGTSGDQSGGDNSVKNVRDGVHDGIQGFRNGIRNVVKTVTGGNNEHDGDNSAGGS